MSKRFPALQGGFVGRAAYRNSAADPEPSAKLLQSCDTSSTSSEGSERTRENNADYADVIQELVMAWLMEDLDVTASVCQAKLEDVFGDVLALLASDTPQLHKSEAGYPDSIKQLLGWMLDDIGSVARSFHFDPADVFGDALKLIVSDTSLADHITEVAGLSASAFGDHEN